MKPTQSPSANTPDSGSSNDTLEWKSKDYGLGPEPPTYSWEWMQWIEDRALLAGISEDPGPWQLAHRAKKLQGQK
jgi:hypothetical protein